MRVTLRLITRPLALAATVLISAAAPGLTAASAPEIPAEFRDAPAVVVEHEVDWDIWLNKSTTRVKKRILIRKEAGNDQADQSIYYGKPDSELRDFSARTIQPDGSVVPVPEGLRRDLVAFRSGDREVRVVQFTFPGVRVGSILEWRYEIYSFDRNNFEWWEVQESIPVLQTDFEIRFHRFPDAPIRIGPQARIPFGAWCNQQPAKREGRTVAHRYTCRNVPAFEREPWAPPDNESRLRLLMSWWPSTAPPLNRTIWRNVGELWRDRIRRLFKKDGDAQQIVARLRSEAESDTEMVDLVYDWVKNHLEVRDFAFDDDLEKGRGESASVAEILERGGGTPNEIAIATLRLLRRAEIDARPVLVGNRARERLDWDFPDPPADLHVLLEVVTDGKTGFLDPGCDLCGPGTPDWRYCAGSKSGIRIDLASDRVDAVDVPPMRSILNQERIQDEIRLSADGIASVTGSVRWFGQHDVSVRRSWQDLTASGRRDSLRGWIAGDIEDFEVRSSDPSEFRDTLLAEYTYKRRDMALPVEERLLIAPPDVFTPRLAVPMQEERKLPLWWIYPYSVVQEAIFTLPEGFEIGDLPDVTQLAGPGLKYLGKWRKEEETGRLRWEAILTYDRISLAPAEYAQARQFALDLFRDLRRGIVVRRSATTAEEVDPR